MFVVCRKCTGLIDLPKQQVIEIKDNDGSRVLYLMMFLLQLANFLIRFSHFTVGKT